MRGRKGFVLNIMMKNERKSCIKRIKDERKSFMVKNRKGS